MRTIGTTNHVPTYYKIQETVENSLQGTFPKGQEGFSVSNKKCEHNCVLDESQKIRLK